MSDNEETLYKLDQIISLLQMLVEIMLKQAGAYTEDE